jgi:DNA-binding LytR/AlgR family response regulator
MHEKTPYADSVDPQVLIADDKTVNERSASLMEMATQLKVPISKPSKIAIKMEGRIIFIDPAEVISAEAQGNYVLLVQTSRSYLLRGSISAVGEKLLPYGFIRIHRSVLLNASWVQEIQPYTTGEYLLRTRGGKEYTVSRTYKKNLKSLAQIWIGSDALFAE